LMKIFPCRKNRHGNIGSAMNGKSPDATDVKYVAIDISATSNSFPRIMREKISGGDSIGM